MFNLWVDRYNAFQRKVTRFLMMSLYFPEPQVDDGRFGYTRFFFHGGDGHYTEDIRFEYSGKHKTWLLMEADFQYTSDTPTEEGGYDNHEGSYHKTQKDFGIIGINQYNRSLPELIQSLRKHETQNIPGRHLHRQLCHFLRR